jgi:hypothetical protein
MGKTAENEANDGGKGCIKCAILRNEPELPVGNF